MVYFEALKDRLYKGFQGLILLPEIGLTGQFENKFFEFFGFQACSLALRNYKKKQRNYLEWMLNGEI